MPDSGNMATLTSARSRVEREKELADLLERMADEVKVKGAVDLAEWKGRFPELASEIERLAPTVEAMVHCASLMHPTDHPHPDPLPEGEGEEAGPKTLGDFRIVRELGRGGMGIVYEAEQLSLQRRVALKILPTAAVLDPRTLQRFKNEAQAAAALDHPHIVDVYGIGCERGVHYYAMRLIEGCTLAEVVEDIGDRHPEGTRETGGQGDRGTGDAGQEPVVSGQEPVARTDAVRNPKSKIKNPKFGSTAPVALLSTVRTANAARFYRLVAELGMHVAEGLEHAHGQGVIHRDIKPSNLMLDGQGKVWITDFGLAHIEANQTLTVSGDLIGTLRYMSPEQALANRAPVDHRTDIYSLGATLYELLTLQPVFGESERAVLLSKIALSEPTPPRKLDANIPADLETIVLKMLEKDPGSRYASAADLAADLGRFVENKPIAARRPSWRNRLAKWSSRNRSLVGAIAATLLVVSAIVGGIFGWWGRDSAARRMVAERIAGEALESAGDLAEQKQWERSRVELRRAEAALSAQYGSAALRDEIHASQANAEMVLRLEEIRLNASAIVHDEFDYAGTNAAYTKAFADYGISALNLPPRKLGEVVRQSAICEELAAALTDWSVVRLRMGGESDPHRLPLLFAAKLADGDEWRDRLRQRWKREELLEMAHQAELATLPPSTLSMFIDACTFARANDQQVQEKIRSVQRSHAGDFWINQAAAYFFANTEPPQLDEAIRYYSVAAGLKPEAAAAHNNLGVALFKVGRREEAIAELRRAIEIAPDFWAAKTNLDKATANRGQ